MNYGGICVLVLGVIMPAVFAATDYCNVNLCHSSIKHIACENNGDFAYICTFPRIVNITKNYQRLITIKHNLLRNKIAKGFKMFPPAQRMATMVWDDELAKLAELNVKQCEMRYDQCRNTPRFLYAGQNVASTTWKGRRLNESEITESQILEWFKKYKHCPFDVIPRYNTSIADSCTRFTTMVQDKSTHIGCAILRSASCGYTQQIMTCNYAYGNTLNAPVYIDGVAASQCTTGTNRLLTSLCSVREVYN